MKYNKEAASAKQGAKILETAGRLFLEYGYHETSIRQIARELDISPGLIGYYFPTKRDLAVALLSRQLMRFAQLDSQYVPADDPVLRSAVLIKLEITVLNSPVFKKFYLGALKEDVILTVIRASGQDIYRAIADKYHLDYPDSRFAMNDLLASSIERTLVLYADDIQLERSIADEVFLINMRLIYGSEDFLLEKCRESELITARILCDHPEILKDWL